MRWLLAGIAALVLAGASATSAAAAPFAVGGGKNAFVGTGGPVHLMVSAHGTGADATGWVESSGDLGIGEFQQGGPVTCVLVAGNRAAIKYRVEQAHGSGAPPVGTVVQVFIEDNGTGVPDANATDVPDFTGGTADLCRDPTTQLEWNPIDSGNYTVAG